MKHEIVKLLNEGLSYRQISKQLGCSKGTIGYHAKRINKPYHPAANNRYDWQKIREFYDLGYSFRACQEKFGFSGSAWEDAIKAGKIQPRELGIPIEAQLIENCKHSRTHIKRKLINLGLLQNKCADCGQLPIWLGQPLVMVLDHINGISDDYRLDNLRLLCPNCNSQTETFSGRNIKRK
jgi:Helix-turn-helix domain